MNFKTYQDAAHSFAAYKGSDYPAFALVEEVGELFTYIAKNERGDEDYAHLDDHRDAIVKEAGDILWQLNELCLQLGITLDEAATKNIQKLSQRAVNGTIIGDGDDR